jgi:hypothetical protein
MDMGLSPHQNQRSGSYRSQIHIWSDGWALEPWMWRLIQIIARDLEPSQVSHRCRPHTDIIHIISVMDLIQTPPITDLTQASSIMGLSWASRSTSGRISRFPPSLENHTDFQIPCTNSAQSTLTEQPLGTWPSCHRQCPTTTFPYGCQKH